MKGGREATEHGGEATTALIPHTRRDIDVTVALGGEERWGGVGGGERERVGARRQPLKLLIREQPQSTLRCCRPSNEKQDWIDRYLGDGMAQLVERQTRNSKTRDSNPVKSTREKNVRVFPSYKINDVMTRYRCAYARIMITYAR